MYQAPVSSPCRSLEIQHRLRRYAEASSVLIDAVELYEDLRRGDPAFPRNTGTDRPRIDRMAVLVAALFARKNNADVLLRSASIAPVWSVGFMQGRSSLFWLEVIDSTQRTTKNPNRTIVAQN